MSLREDAAQYIEDEKKRQTKAEEKERLIKIAKKKKVTNPILASFKVEIHNMPVLRELLCDWFEISTHHNKETISMYLESYIEEISFFEKDIGIKGLSLMQYKFWDLDDGHEINEMQAWAIKYKSVFDRDIYLIPYKKLPKFAVTVDKRSRWGIEDEFRFPGDLPRESSLKIVSEYLKK